MRTPPGLDFGIMVELRWFEKMITSENNYFNKTTLFLLREDFKKKISKRNDIVQKRGGGLRKKSNFECVNKNDILIGGEGGQNQCHFFKMFQI